MVTRKISTKDNWKGEKRMKICFLGPSIKECGGLQRVISVLANALAKNHEVSIISVNNKENAPYYPLDNTIGIVDYQLKYEEHILQKAVRGLAKKRNLVLPAQIAEYAYYPKSSTQGLLNLLKREEYDCIIASTDYYSLLVGVIAEELRPAKLIAWHHNSFPIYFQTPGMASYIQSNFGEKGIASLRYCSYFDKDGCNAI